MAVAYEELAGSPTLTMDRQGGTAKRVVKIAWADIEPFLFEVFPFGNVGFPLTASFPGYRWLRAQSVDVEAFDPENPNGQSEAVNRYDTGGARVTINYAPNSTEDGEENQGDMDGADEIVFLENEVNVTGEYLIWPNQGVRWELNGAGDYVSCKGGDSDEFAGATGYDRNVQVSEEIRVGIIIPMIEHSLTWNYVRRPPWIAIRETIGCVNNNKWAGADPETLLFTGVTASRQTTSRGVKAWKVNYKFQEKCVNYPVPAGEDAIGWNHFLRPLGKETRWDRLQYGPSCRNIYRRRNFRKLFGNR